MLQRDAQTHPTWEDFAPERLAARMGKPLEAVSLSPLPASSPTLLVNVLGCVPGEQMCYCMVSPPHIMAVTSTDFARGHFLIQQLTWPQAKNKI